MPDLSLQGWLLVTVAAALVGFAKTSLGGAASISVAVFAAVLPSRESTGTLLPLLLVGDVLAVLVYRRHAHWGLLLRLLPWVAVGTVLGVFFVAHVDDHLMRKAIGAVLLLLVALQLVSGGGRLQRWVGDPSDGRRTTSHRVSAALTGVVAGFTTMVANAAGAVMTLYLLMSGLPMLEFLGTGAWFFLIVNAFKVPFSAALGLLDTSTLAFDLRLVPAVVAGAAAGLFVIRRTQQRQFEWAALSLTAVSAVALLR
ncbi:MAG: sulfite exporter TauE/SafE family protein [Actinomycetes bacterium]